MIVDPEDVPSNRFVDALPEGFGSLIDGAIDLHVHGQPDLSREFANRGADIAVARLAVEYGIRGWVMKSHLWPTMDRAALLQEQFDPDEFFVLGSITLNPPNGGVNLTSVELAAAHGAKVVFLPTWGSSADIERGGYIPMLLGRVAPSFPEYQAAHPQSVIDANGALSGVGRDILDACKSLGILLATGHVSLAESLALAARSAEIGAPLLVNHPLHYADDIAPVRELADRGAFVEFSSAPLVHPDSHSSVGEVFRAIEAVGSTHTVLSSDVFSRWVPPEPESLRMFAEQLRYLGCSPEQLREMLVANPLSLLTNAGAIGAAA
jgi:hypothetical protein